jgi:hypothetical protein
MDVTAEVPEDCQAEVDEAREIQRMHDESFEQWKEDYAREFPTPPAQAPAAIPEPTMDRPRRSSPANERQGPRRSRSPHARPQGPGLLNVVAVRYSGFSGRSLSQAIDLGQNLLRRRAAVTHTARRSLLCASGTAELQDAHPW